MDVLSTTRGSRLFATGRSVGTLQKSRGFLGTMGTIRMFIKDYATHTKPLVNLTRKDVDFEFGAEHLAAMNTLKHLASTCPAIRAIDYSSPNEVCPCCRLVMDGRRFHSVTDGRRQETLPRAFWFN